MADRWSDEFSTRVREWCDDVAALGVDVLADAGLVSRADFERAADIVAEEMFVRLCLLDYPPSPEAPASRRRRTRRCSRRRGMIRFWDFKLTGAPPLLSLGVRLT